MLVCVAVKPTALWAGGVTVDRAAAGFRGRPLVAITAVAEALLQHTTLRGMAVKQVIGEAVDRTLPSANPIPR
jgi:hypothetical protein